MIVDTLSHADAYEPFQEHFAKAFRFLQVADFSSMDNGRHDILGDDLFVIIDRGQGRGRESSLLEYHRNYIDIQFVVEGKDEIGWMPLADCTRVSTPYDPHKDVGFFYDRPGTWIAVSSGMFAIFFPHDAHAPLGGSGPLFKAVIKVAVSS